MWTAGPVPGPVLVQTSAHGTPRPGTIEPANGRRGVVRWTEPQRRVAPGQSVVLYRDDLVLGGATADIG